MRYVRLYLHFLKFALAKASEFRIDFYLRTIMDIIFYIVQFMFFEILYIHTPFLGGWDINEIRLFVASGIFIDALNMTVFSSGSWQLTQNINAGALDYYLTRPVSSLFFLSLKDFAANSFLNLVLATSILFYYVIKIPFDIAFWKIIVFILLLCNGTYLYYLMQLLFNITTFWSGSPRGFSDIFMSMGHAYERPDGVWKGYTRKFFLFVFPLILVASYPVRFLIEPARFDILGQIIITTIIFSLVVFKCWDKGLKAYSSASS